MDLDARPYRAFVMVADLKSFRRAADALHLSQPALSAQVRELERRLGFALFARTSRIVRLTPEGALMLDKARRYLLENDWINQAARDIRSTKLRIGAAHHTAAIAERNAAIDRFLLGHPRLPVNVVGRSYPQLIDDLASNEIDVAITLEPEGDISSPVERSLPGGIERIVLHRRPVGLAVPKESGEAVSLANMPIAVVNRAHGAGISEMVAHALAAAGAELIHPPEGDGPAVLRHAALMRMAAVDLGWFACPEGLTSIAVPELAIGTALVALARRQQRRGATDLFLSELRGEGDGA